jgi:hypothetical protein
VGDSNAVSEFAEGLLIPGSTTLWALIHATEFDLDARHLAALVVRDIGKFGIVTVDDLISRPIVKSCWLAATLELERAAKLLCRRRLSDCLSVLPKARYDAAVRQFAARVGSIPKKGQERLLWIARQLYRADIDALTGGAEIASGIEPLVLGHTMLADKRIMLLKGPFRPSLDVKKTEKLFSSAEKLRNWCAHPSSEPELRFETFAQLRTLLLEIRNLTGRLTALADSA